ncbi:MAG: hypothetical protein K8F34_00215 [Candidatus Kuenenia stuttgartiensis]|nr:hypothetical protein [Candidatus Kuenenia stuttgartiensis]
MRGRGKRQSDQLIVPGKSGNSGGGKGLTNRCIEEEKQLPNAESENKLQTKLNRLSEIARVEPKTKFISLAHLLNEENLRQCYEELKKEAASGIDKVSHKKYGEGLEANLRDLVCAVKLRNNEVL